MIKISWLKKIIKNMTCYLTNLKTFSNKNLSSTTVSYKTKLCPNWWNSAKRRIPSWLNSKISFSWCQMWVKVLLMWRRPTDRHCRVFWVRSFKNFIPSSFNLWRFRSWGYFIWYIWELWLSLNLRTTTTWRRTT